MINSLPLTPNYPDIQFHTLIILQLYFRIGTSSHYLHHTVLRDHNNSYTLKLSFKPTLDSTNMSSWDPNIPYLMIVDLHSPGSISKREDMREHARSLTPHSELQPIAEPICNSGDVVQWWVQIPALPQPEKLRSNNPLNTTGHYHFFELKMKSGKIVFEDKACNCYGDFAQNTTHDMALELNLEKWSEMEGLAEVFAHATKVAQAYNRKNLRPSTTVQSDHLRPFLSQSFFGDPEPYGGESMQPQYPVPLDPGSFQQSPYHQYVPHFPGRNPYDQPPSTQGQPIHQFVPQPPVPYLHGHPQPIQQQPAQQFPVYHQTSYTQNTAGLPVNLGSGGTAQEARRILIHGMPRKWNEANLRDWMHKINPNLKPAKVEMKETPVTRSTIKATVAFWSHEDAEQAVQDLDEQVFGGSSKASVRHDMSQAVAGEIEPTSQLPQQ